MKKLIYILLGLIIITSAKADFLDKGTIILGRPTDNSVSMNILAKNYIEFFIEYGTERGVYNTRGGDFSSKYPEPVVLKLDNLKANTQYFYRINYREDKNSEFTASDEYFFQTQRAKGTSFSFTVEADPHLYDKKGSSGLMKVNMVNQAKDSADFILDLGDTFGDDHNPTTITDEEVKKLHINNLPFFGILCHSSPLFLCLGNHEGESGYYLLQTPPNNLAVYETKWRKKYYPNPEPDGFYTGNTDEEQYGIGKPQNYYAFEWGDALFVILDVYRYYTAIAKPQKWDWTIGNKQYQWFKSTLEGSKAKYKFVFAHHVLGQGRGAINDAILYEWGGWEDTKKTKWGFTKNRPGWEKPIHQLMVDNGVQIFFQGHDHLFAKEMLDGIIYQEVPIPCDSTYNIGYLANADAYTDLKLDGAGYLRVNVNSENVKVDYVKSYLPKDETDSLKNRMTGYSYTVKPGKTDVKEITDNEPAIEIYPNPVTELLHLNIKLLNKQRIMIEILDMAGREVATYIDGNSYDSGTYNFDIPFKNMSAGVYILNVITGKDTNMKTFLYIP